MHEGRPTKGTGFIMQKERTENECSGSKRKRGEVKFLGIIDHTEERGERSNGPGIQRRSACVRLKLSSQAKGSTFVASLLVFSSLPN